MGALTIGADITVGAAMVVTGALMIGAGAAMVMGAAIVVTGALMMGAAG